MEAVLLVASWAAAITAIIIASKHLWNLFVTAVKSAVSEEIGKFHRELDSVDTFWTERIDKLETGMRELKTEVEYLSKRIP